LLPSDLRDVVRVGADRAVLVIRGQVRERALPRGRRGGETALAPAVTGSVDKVFSRNGRPRLRKSEGRIVLRTAR